MAERKHVHVHLIADEPGDPSVGIWGQLVCVDLRIRDTHFFEAVERADFEAAFREFMKPWFDNAQIYTRAEYDRRYEDRLLPNQPEDLL